MIFRDNLIKFNETDSQPHANPILAVFSQTWVRFLLPCHVDVQNMLPQRHTGIHRREVEQFSRGHVSTAHGSLIELMIFFSRSANERLTRDTESGRSVRPLSVEVCFVEGRF